MMLADYTQELCMKCDEINKTISAINAELRKQKEGIEIDILEREINNK